MIRDLAELNFDDINVDKMLSGSDEQYKAMFEFYKNNPSVAAIDLLKQDLAPFQRKIVNGCLTHSYVINVLARGSGKTRMMALVAALEAIFNPKKRIGFLGPQFRVSKLAFAEFEAIHSESEFLQGCVKRISKQTDTWSVEFHNRAFLFAMPLAADSKASVRGTRLHSVLLDEYPHIPKDVLDAVITPMLATSRNPMARVRQIEKEEKLIKAGKLKKEDITTTEKNRILGFSSAYFRYNHMWTTINQYRETALEQKKKVGKSDYAVYVFNYQDAPKGFFDLDMIEHARKTSAEIIFRMEYLSEFPADSDGFFKRSLIDSCISRDDTAFSLEKHAGKDGIYFMGIDPARNHDAFAISIVKLVQNEMRLVRVLSYQNTPLPLIASEIRRLIRLYNVTLIGMDAGGGGLAMKDLLGDVITAADKEDIILDIDDENANNRHGKKILKMINFTSDWIHQSNFEMRASFEHKRLMLPNLRSGETFIKPDIGIEDVDDAMILEFFELVKELESIIVEVKKSGVMHFDTEKQSLRKDRYSSLLIAHRITADYIKSGFRQKELGMGGWLSGGGNLITTDSEQDIIDDWKITRTIDAIREININGRPGKYDGASLE